MAENNSIENQPEHFVGLSENIIKVSTSLKKPDIPLCIQYCPMANKDNGVHWLSSIKEIRSPYHCEAMLTCGGIKKVIYE